MAGIIGYGAYIPRYRIKVEDIASVWGADAEAARRGLMVGEKSVAAPDQDTISMTIEASRGAMVRANISPLKIGAVYVGSESHPYAVKPTATVVAEAVGATPRISCADLEFACNAGAEAIRVSSAMVDAGRIDCALAAGADTSQGAPGDPLEYSTGAGAASFVIGRENCIAEIEAEESYVTDTPDFWRRSEHRYPSHGGRFTGEPAYFKHITSASKALMEKCGLKPADIDYAVFHQPNGKFPSRAAQILGFEKEQIAAGLLSPKIGNTYSASSLLGLCAVLDIAEPGSKILLCSYGSGAGSDAFLLEVKDRIKERRDKAPLISEILKNRIKYIDYSTYAKFTGMIVKEG